MLFVVDFGGGYEVSSLGGIICEGFDDRIEFLGVVIFV